MPVAPSLASGLRPGVEEGAAVVAVVLEEGEAFLLAMSFRKACIWRTTSKVSGSTAISSPYEVVTG